MNGRLPMLSLLALAGLSACASQSDIPSLAPRAAEYELSGRPVPPCIAPATNPASTAAAQPLGGPVVAPDPELPGRIDSLLAEARGGGSDFDARLPAAQAAAAKAGAPESESWVAAQLAISRLEAARARTQDAVAAIDDLLAVRIKAGNTAQEDLDRLSAASTEARALSDRQQAELDRLNAAVR